MLVILFFVLGCSFKCTGINENFDFDQNFERYVGVAGAHLNDRMVKKHTNPIVSCAKWCNKNNDDLQKNRGNPYYDVCDIFQVVDEGGVNYQRCYLYAKKI